MSDPISKKAIPSGGSWADEVKENPDKKETAKDRTDSDSSGVRKKGW